MLEQIILRGEVSTVYQAADAQDAAARYAIKELSTVALFRAEERRESEAALHRTIEAWSAIAHPGIARIVDVFSARDKHYVVFELVAGPNTEQIIADRRLRTTPELARNWGAQLCDLLAALHAQDPPLHVPFLSPAHVMIGGDGRVKLVGFGLSRLFRPGGASSHGSVHGYAAPELAEGVPSVRTDLFAVGRLLFALLIGRLLERGRLPRMTLRQAVPGIPAQLVRAIAQAAHKSPERRFGSARELMDALWDQANGPLLPIEDWMAHAVVSEWAAAHDEPAAPVRGAQREASMADLGFARDPRFGPAPAPAPQPIAAKPKGSPKLSVYPHLLNLGELGVDTAKRAVLTLRNVGDADLTGRVLSHVSWLKAPEKTISLPPQKQARVLLSVRAASLPPGRTNEPQALSVETNGGRQWVGVTADVAAGAVLRVEPLILDYGSFQDAQERTLAVTISNAGRQPLSGSVTASVPWLRAALRSFSCAAGATTRVAVSLLPEALPRGPQDAERALLVESDGGQEQIAARAWRQVPQLDLGATHMDFGAVRHDQVAERYLYVGNVGDGLLQGSARSLLPWLQVYPEQFRCEPGEMAQLTVAADPTGLADGALDVPRALRLQTNVGAQSLSLHLEVRAPVLVLGTERLDFGSVPLGETAQRTIVLRNAGSAPLEAAIRSLANWLAVATEQVRCAPGEAATIAVQANTAGFARGQDVALDAGLRVVAGSDIRQIPVTMRVVQPALQVEPEALDFGYVDPAAPESRELTIANGGNGSLAWNLQTEADWLEINPTSGICDETQQQRVVLTAYGLALDSEVSAASATVVVNSDAGRVKIPVRVGLASPLLATDTTWLDLGTSVNFRDVSASLRIFNHGLGLLRGYVSADATWLALDRASFECATGRSVEIRVTADMTEFPSDGASEGRRLITVESNGGRAEVQVSLRVEMQPSLEVPEDLPLESVQADGELRGRLVIRNVGMAPAHVELSSPSPAIVLSRDLCDIKPGKAVRISVHLAEGELPADAQAYIEVRTAVQRSTVLVRLTPAMRQEIPDHRA